MAHKATKISPAEARRLTRIGQGVTLIKCKRDMKRGEWLPFLKKFGICQRTAQHYMRLAREYYGDRDGLRPMTVVPTYTALTPDELGGGK